MEHTLRPIQIGVIVIFITGVLTLAFAIGRNSSDLSSSSIEELHTQFDGSVDFSDYEFVGRVVAGADVLSLMLDDRDVRVKTASSDSYFELVEDTVYFSPSSEKYILPTGSFLCTEENGILLFTQQKTAGNQAETDTLDSVLATYNSLLSRFDSMVANYEQLLSSRATMAEQLQVEIESKAGELLALQEKYAAWSDFDAINASLGEATVAVSQLYADIASTQSALITLQGEITSLQTKQQELTASKASWQTTLNTRNSKIAELEGKVNNLNKQITDTKASIAEANAEVTRLNGVLAADPFITLTGTVNQSIHRYCVAGGVGLVEDTIVSVSSPSTTGKDGAGYYYAFPLSKYIENVSKATLVLNSTSPAYQFAQSQYHVNNTTLSAPTGSLYNQNGKTFLKIYANYYNQFSSWNGNTVVQEYRNVSNVTYTVIFPGA